MSWIFIVIAIIIWLYLLNVLSRAKLEFWRYMVGSMGLFIIMMVTLRPIMTMPLARVVAGIAGIIGSLTDTFVAFFKYGIIFILTEAGSMTLKIDFECSGIIEIMAYLSLLAFFKVYNLKEKVMVSVVGVVYILICNALRIALICEVVYFFGVDAYFVAHTFLGRIFFYVLTVILYFNVFTKAHIIKMKVGNFSYGNNKSTT